MCCCNLFVWLVLGATAFVLSLLEPNPDKRPSVRAAMEEKWINEGYAKKPLHIQAHKNRYRTTENFISFHSRLNIEKKK